MPLAGTFMMNHDENLIKKIGMIFGRTPDENLGRRTLTCHTVAIRPVATWEADVTSSTSPTVRRRRLAAELRRLRGTQTGTTVARALGWSPAKVSRYELGQGSFPLEEIEKLVDYYGVTEPRRAQLLALAVEANERGWWEDYADALSPTYRELLGLESGAVSELVWQGTAVPGLLQTEEYAHAIHTAHQQAVLDPPGLFEQRTAVRMIRQQVLASRNPPLQLSVVIDEAVLLRKVGTREVMSGQLRHLAKMSELPNVELRILPLQSETSLRADSFTIFGFSSENESDKLGDVVNTEAVTDQLSIEGESDTYVFRLIFRAFAKAALTPEESRERILQTAQQLWGLGSEFASSYARNKSTPLGGTERENGTVDILTVPDSNALAGRCRDLDTVAGPIRPRAPSKLSAPLPTRALSVIADNVTHGALPCVASVSRATTY
jgi:transcriptional regulator with XRE-family HTH domain